MSLFPFMTLQGPQTHVTESYVSVPPALVIVDELGAVWTLGFTKFLGDERGVSRGEFAFNVLRNGLPVGEWANRIEMRAGRIRIFGPEGWKQWTGNTFV